MTDLPVPRRAARDRLARLGFERAAAAALSLRSAAGYFGSAGYPDAADTYRQLAEGVERDVAQLPRRTPIRRGRYNRRVYQAVSAAADLGLVALVFVLGILFERHRHASPPTTYHVHLYIEDSPHDQQTAPDDPPR